MITEKELYYIKELQRFEKKLNWLLSSTDLKIFVEIFENTQGITVCTSCKSDLANAKTKLIEWKNNKVNSELINIELINKELEI